MFRLTAAFLLVAAVAACGGPTGRPAHPAAKSVLVVQIDGLTPDLLSAHMSRPTSRAADAGLHRLLGLGQGASQAPLSGSMTQVATVLPATGAALAATVLTGQAPATHGVRADGDALAAPVLGKPVRLETGDDASRVQGAKAALDAGSSLVFVRLTGVAGGWSEGPTGAAQALVTLDRQLAAFGPTPDDVVVVTLGGHGAWTGELGTGRGVDAFAKYLEVDPETLHMTGGLLRLTGADDAVAKKLAEMDFVALVARVEADGVKVFDAALDGMRPLEAVDSDAPSLAARLVRSGAPGDLLALPARSEGYFFQPGDGSAVRFGGATSAESVVPLVVSGARVGHVDLSVEAEGIGPMIQGLLGASADPAAAALRARRARAAGFVTDLGGDERQLPVALLGSIEAFRRGDPQTALMQLDAGRFSGAAETWRRLFAAWARKLTVGDWPCPDGDTCGEFPAADGFVGALAKTLAIQYADDETRPALLLEAPDPGDFKGRQRATLRAFHLGLGLVPAPFCDLPTPTERVAQLATLADSLGSPGLAAHVHAQRAFWLRHPDTAAAALKRAIELAERPGAEWARAHVAQRVLFAQLSHPAVAGAARATLDQAARIKLLATQWAIAKDDADGAQDRNVLRLAGLSDGLVSRLPELLDETIAMGVGDTPSVAAEVVRTVLSEGGITAFLQGDPVGHARKMLTVMNRALKPFKDQPLAELDAEARVALVVPAMIEGALGLVEGRPGDAAAALQQADTILSGTKLLDAADAALAAAGEDEAAGLAAWGPFVHALVKFGLSAFSQAMQQPDAAQAYGRAGVDILRQIARRALRREGLEAALGSRVDELAAFVAPGVDYVLAAISEDEAGIAAAQAASRAALGKLTLAVSAGEAAEASRWLVLLGVLARDAWWIAEAMAGREPASAELASTSRAVDALVGSWKPESAFGRGALVVLQSTQGVIPSLPAAFEADDLPGALKAAPALEAALQRMRNGLRAEFPADTLRARMRAEDRADLYLLDQILVVLESPAALWTDGEALAKHLIEHNSKAYPKLVATAGEARLLFALEQGVMNSALDRFEAANSWFTKGRKWSATSAFEQHRFVWDVLLARSARRAGDAAGMKAALDSAAKCRPISWQLAMARGVMAAHGGAPGTAHGLFAEARRGARQNLSGPLFATLKLDARDENTIISGMLELSVLGSLLGKQSGTFQLGLGQQTNASNMRSVGWSVGSKGTPRDVAEQTLILDAWVGLLAGDDGVVDLALSRLAALWQGLDPRDLETPAAEAPLLPFVDGPISDPRAALWVAVLAEARGHVYANLVMQRVVQASDWEGDGISGARTHCDFEAPEDAPPAVAHVRCQVPAVFGWMLGDAVDAVGAFVDLKLRDDVGDAERKRVIAAAHAAAPQLVPAWRAGQGSPPPGVQAVLRLMGGDPSAYEAAVAAGFKCAGPPREASVPPQQVARAMADCGASGPRVEALLKSAEAHGPSKAGVAALVDGIRLADQLASVRPPALNYAWPAGRKLVDGAPPQERAALARQIADAAAAIEAWPQAVDFGVRALAHAAQNDVAFDAAPVIALALAHHLRATPATRLLTVLKHGTPEQAKISSAAYLARP